MSGVQTLVGVLNCSESRAEALLRESGGDLDTAIALHFSRGHEEGQGRQQSPRTQLRSIVGGHVSQAQAAALLRRAGGSVESAADLYFEQQEEAGPSRAAAGRAGSEPITIDGTSEEEERGRRVLPDHNGAAALPRSGRSQPTAASQPRSRSGGGRTAAAAVRPGSAAARPSVVAARPSAAAARPASGSARTAATAAAARPVSGGAGRRHPAQHRQQTAAAAAVPALDDSSPTSSSSSEEGSSSSGEESSGPPSPIVPGMGVVGGGFLNLLGRLFPHIAGGHAYSSDDEEEEEEPAGLPRNTGNAAVTQRRLPSLQAAAALKVQSQDRPRVPRAQLPLPDLRVGGRLHSDSQDDVPSVVKPSAPTWLPCKLGTLLLPLHWVNPEAQTSWLAQQWDSQRGRYFSFQVPAIVWRSSGVYFSIDQAQQYGHSVAELEANARLKLTDGNRTELALISENNSWVSEFLYSLYVLQTAGIVTWTLRLHPHPGNGSIAAAGPSSKGPGGQGKGSGAGAAAGGGRKGKGRGGAAAGEAAAGRGSAHLSGRTSAGGRGRGRDRTTSGTRTTTGEEAAGPSTAGQAEAAAAEGEEAAGGGGRPTHAKLELSLANGAKQQLWWDGEEGEFHDAGEDGGHGKKKQGGRKGMQLTRYKKNGTALAKVVAALLQFGEGLRLGPDCDGLLNFGDTPQEEWDQQPGAGQAGAFRKLFDVQRLLDSVKTDPSARAAVAPGGLIAHPKHYQLQGLQWMLDRERRGDAVGRGQLHLHPAWLQLVAPKGELLYMHRLHPNVLSSNFYSAPVGGTCGGFLCDEMGLGKTLQTLMLIMSNPAPAGWAVEKLEGALVKDEDGTDLPAPIKTTLIVVPSNILGQWMDEIERHLSPGTLTWAVYKPGLKPSSAEISRRQPGWNTPQRGTRRSRRVQEAQVEGKGATAVWCQLPEGQDGENGASSSRGGGGLLAMHEADLVLISYEQLRDELHSSKGHSSLLHQFGFWRVVLDEAQLVANSSSVAAVMASSLWRRHAWVVTGTPITARLDEVKGLLEFLAYEPFYHSHAWRGLVQAEFSDRSVAGLLSMRALLRGVMLRRSKADVADELELPPCLREDRYVPLTSVERLVYEGAKRSFVDAAYHLRQQQDAAGRQGGPRARQSGRAVGRALQALTALRQSCCHPQIVRRQDDVLGKERLSMRQIMDRLVSQAYSEWDMAARTLVQSKAMLAAVQCGEGGHPGEALRPLLELVRQNQEAALSTDIRHEATAHRRMDAGIVPPEAAGGEGETAGGEGMTAPVQQQQQQQQLEDKGKGKAPAEDPPPPAAAAAVPLAGRKRQREGEDGDAAEAGPSTAVGRPRRNGRAGSVGPSGSAGEGSPALEGSPEAAASPGNGAAGGSGQGPPGPAQQQPGEEQEEISEEERERRKEARGRARAWQKLELDLLHLYRHMLQLCAAPPKPSKGRSSKRAKTDSNGAGSSLAAAAEQAAPDKEVLEAELQEAVLAVERLQAELGLDDGPGLVRRSKRQAGVEAEDEIVMDAEDEEALQEQILHAKVILRSYAEVLKRRDPERSASTAVASAEKEAGEKWHHLQHLLNKEAALVAAEKGKAAASDADAAGPARQQAAGTAQQEDLNTCPICLDDLTTRTITACGHHYCSSCIREVLATGRRTCPICRADIREEDLFDACSEEEARLKEAAAAGGAGSANADYGSKVSALLAELAAMRAADPEAKAVVFSSWGRLLKLVGDALTANGVEHASLCGATLAQRQEALHRFVHDPHCAVLTVVLSTSGGAAGLTLTVASTAFIMEPTLNPGLESQAAARIYRLGQTKPTRVIRLLAEDTIEAKVLEIQKRKLESGEAPAETALQEVDPGLLLQLYEDIK